METTSRSFATLLRLFLAAAVAASAGCGAAANNSRQGLGLASGDASPNGQSCTDFALYQGALNTLQTSCYGCHGKGGTSPGGPADVTDVATLISKGLIVPFNANGSPLVEAITNGTMPPAGKTPPTAAAMLALTTWVNGGAPAFTADETTSLQTSCSATSGGAPGSAPQSPASGATPAPGAQPPSAPSPGGTPAAAATPTQLATNAITVLNTYCAQCHANGASSGGVGNITNLQSDITANLVVAGNPGGSKLYTAMNGGGMPPAGSPVPTAADIAAVAAWIQNGAAVTPPTVPTTPQLQPTDVFNLVVQDLQKVATTNNNAGTFTRYISFANLADATATTQALSNYANGISRLVNSMSTNQVITKPVPIDAGKTVFRIDLRDYNWTVQQWNDIINAYPYATLQRSLTLQNQFLNLAGTALPVVNGDWFTFTVSQFPFYNELLQLPTNEDGLEQQQGFSEANDLQATLTQSATTNTQVYRSGFAHSGVALNNRAMDRYVTVNGSYWRSYDFALLENGNAQQEAVKSVFADPLGSARLINTQNLFGVDLAFQEDAGEIIFSLPNRLQGFFLVDGNANQLNAAALDVAEDPIRPQHTILNGYSCMRCHAPGLLKNPSGHDEVAAASAVGGFTADEKTLINLLYGNQTATYGFISTDTQRYLSAMSDASYDPTNTEPMILAGNLYEEDVTLPVAADVAGLTTQDFLNRLSNASSGVKEALAPLAASGGTVTRQVFEAEFPQLVIDFFGNIPTP